jgi:hypothetical protein
VNVFRGFNGVGAGLSVVQTVVRSLKELALGVLLGTQSMDNALCTLLDVKLISGRDAHEVCRVKSEFECYLSSSESA